METEPRITLPFAIVDERVRIGFGKRVHILTVAFRGASCSKTIRFFVTELRGETVERVGQPLGDCAEHVLGKSCRQSRFNLLQHGCTAPKAVGDDVIHVACETALQR